VNLHHAANLAKTLGVSVIGLSGSKSGWSPWRRYIYFCGSRSNGENQNLIYWVYHTCAVWLSTIFISISSIKRILCVLMGFCVHVKP
jgi:hypothetical protein